MGALATSVTLLVKAHLFTNHMLTLVWSAEVLLGI
jgi:hypothetical protein